MLWRWRAVSVLVLLLLCVLLLALLLLGTGRLHLSFTQILAVLFDPTVDPLASRILNQVRLPRILTAGMVGAALGLSGAIFQSLSRNPLGSPDVIGFTTGAATGAIVQIILGAATLVQTSIAAVGAGLLTASAVLVLARRGKVAGSSQRMILMGIGVGAMLSGVNTLLLVMGDIDTVVSAQLWLAGSLNARNWDHVMIATWGLFLFAPIALSFARRLALAEMGDEMAAQLGVPLVPTRTILVLSAVGLCSIGTAVAGPIAFVALAAPQIGRSLARASSMPMVTSALVGMVLLMAADWISQRASLNWVLPIGLMTGLMGGIYLLVIVLQVSGNGRPGRAL